MSNGPAEPVHPTEDQRYPADTMQAARRFLADAPIGLRVVARYRVPGGFTDALGYLRVSNETGCSIETRRGVVVVPLVDVVAAKQVPEPPARRRSR